MEYDWWIGLGYFGDALGRQWRHISRYLWGSV